MKEKKNETIEKSIETSLAVLETVGDPTVVNEAKKIRENFQKMSEINKPMVQAYYEDLKNFDKGLVSKYGLQVARVIEAIMIVALFARAYLNF